jgi:hypothetical protein
MKMIGGGDNEDDRRFEGMSMVVVTAMRHRLRQRPSCVGRVVGKAVVALCW